MFLFKFLLLVLAFAVSPALAQTNPNFVDGCALGASVSVPCASGPQPTLNGAFAAKQDFISSYNVKTYGAVGDGVTDDTGAFTSALSACSAGGGGSVILGPKRYLVKGSITVPFGCQVYCPAPLVGSAGPTNPIVFANVNFAVLLNSSATITMSNGSSWYGCAALLNGLNYNPSSTRDLLTQSASFAGTAFNVGSDVTFKDAFIGGFAIGVSSTNLGGARLRMSNVNIDATQCAQFDQIHDVAYIWSLHCFPFLTSGHANADPAYMITSIADNGLGSHLYRVTVSSGTAIQTGDTVWVTSVNGASSAWNRWTATVIDSTHVDLQGSTSLGVTPTGNTVSGSNLVTNISSLSNIGFGSTVSGTGVPGGTTVSAILYTCGCLVLNNEATATNTGITLTIADNAYSSGGSLVLQADYRSGIGIEFTNSDARAVCDGCFTYNHATGFHFGVGADWITCEACATDVGPSMDPHQIAVLIDSNSKGIMFTGYAALAGQNDFVINNSSNGNVPHMIVGSNIESAQGRVLIELDGGNLLLSGNSTQVGGRWVTIADAAGQLTMSANYLRNNFTAQSPASIAKVVSVGNTNSHTTGSISPTSCGSGPTVGTGSNDYGGTITEGTTATGCTIGFEGGFTVAPSCTVTSQSALTSFAYTVASNQIVISHGSASGTLINWTCTSRDGT